MPAAKNDNLMKSQTMNFHNSKGSYQIGLNGVRMEDKSQVKGIVVNNHMDIRLLGQNRESHH